MELSLQILNSSKGWESLRCNAHCLQLCLKAGLSSNGISRLLGASRKLVGHFRHSVVATEELKRRQTQMEIGSKKLIQDCPTRWNSSFYMLERIVEIHWPIAAVLSDESVTKRSDRSLDLRSEQWALAEELVKVLRPFEVTTEFWGSSWKHFRGRSILNNTPVLCGIVSWVKFRGRSLNHENHENITPRKIPAIRYLCVMFLYCWLLASLIVLIVLCCFYLCCTHCPPVPLRMTPERCRNVRFLTLTREKS